MKILQIALITALGFSGGVHLWIAPDHFSHAPAHGLFFWAIGFAQCIWAGIALFRHKRLAQSSWLFITGITLSGGVIVVWLLSHNTWTPYSEEIHPVDWSTTLTKILEAFTFIGLLLTGKPQGIPQAVLRILRSKYVIGVLVSGLTGFAMWGIGMLTEPYFPMLWHGQGDHDHSTHDHGTPVAMTLNTSGYFNIVNTRNEADSLVGISGEDLGELSLHRTTIDANSIARMQDLEGVALPPHVRVDFAPVGNHIMLDRLPRDIYQGDTLNLTLHFSSGRSVSVDFSVLTNAPEGRLNFLNTEGFQISNAWVRATRSVDGLVSIDDGTYAWQLPLGFPVPRVPDNNPMSAEKVELGRYLFYDQRLSGTGTMACSSCHFQEFAFTDQRALPVGVTGDIHPRNAQTLTNVAYNATLTWANPNLLTLERQIVIPMFGEHPVEMGITGNEDIVLERFTRDAQYRELFAAAFPNQTDPITFNNIVLALSSFNRTLISGDSPYDRYLRGERDALSESAQRGMALFFSEELECHHCHTGFNMSLSTISANTTFEERPFFNTGLYNIDGRGAYPPDNTGTHEITNRANDMGRFRPPTLRNIALTAPYMHDGTFATLEDVIQFYMDGGQHIEDGDYAGDGRANPYKSGLVAGFSLTPQEIDDLVAYLESLTDDTFITDPRFANPFNTTAD